MLIPVVSWTLQFGLIAAAIAAVLAAARVRAPRVRLAAWYGALVAGTVAPLAVAAWLPAGPSLLVEGLQATTAHAGTARAAEALDAWTAVGLAVLAIGIVCRAGWLAAGLFRLRRWAHLPPAHSAEFDAAAKELGVRARLVCADVPSPFTFGRHAPVVVAGERVLRDPRVARAAFLHELTHVARRDWTLTLAEEAIRALLWFHPAAWWATAEIRLAREEIVDRAAASRLGSRRVYLEALLSAASPRGSEWRRIPALGLRHQLARRIRALAAEVPMTPRQTAAAVLAVTLALPLSAYAAATAFPVWHVTTTAVGTPEDDVEKPEPIKKVQATYPAEAKKNKVQGDVVLLVTIGADGLVKDAKVTRSIPELDDAALTAIRQWEFRPGRKNGKAVEVLTTITFNFTLK
jgi:TonB family protein